MRKIYIVPNFVTTLNIFCGFYSVVASVKGEYVWAAWLIVFAGVFDMLDGRIARMAKATSSFGIQYDSLSDVISFGMAPAILLFHFALRPFGRLGWLAAFLFLVCGALRLARFNVSVSSDRIPKGYFQGLPIPVAAGLVSTFIIFHNAVKVLWGGFWEDEQIISVFILIMSVTLSSLMVSNVPFPSFKELNWRSRVSFGYLLIAVLTMILIAVQPEITLFLIGAAYFILSLIWVGYQYYKGNLSTEKVLNHKVENHSV